MAIRLAWDAVGEHFYETGSSHAVLYPGLASPTTISIKGGSDTEGSDLDVATAYGAGVAWNGFTGCDESPDGADITKKYANNGEYVSFRAAESLGFTIKAFTYPEAWKACDGRRISSTVAGFSIGQQTRGKFGFSYQTIKGNDTQENDYAVIYHIYYGCSASPSDKSYESVNDSPDNVEFSWECSTTPVTVNGNGSIAEQKLISDCCPGKTSVKLVSIEIDSSLLNASQINILEQTLYGLDAQGGQTPTLPDPGDLLTLLYNKRTVTSG